MGPQAMRAAILPLLLLLPVADAAWRGAGGLEPDTFEDVRDLMMHTEPYDGSDPAFRPVYFQGFVAVTETSTNPNVALLGSRIVPAPSLHHRAILGVWVDCNADGYIGEAESALGDYPAARGSEARCPTKTYSGYPIHNDGIFVTELLAIGMVDPCEYETSADVRASCGVDAWAPNERVFYANWTFVWADVGAPGSVPRAECILTPLPQGTTTGTGPMIDWADCQSRRGVRSAIDDAGLGGQVERPFPVTPFGSGTRPGLLQDDTDKASATVWDCDARPIAVVRDPHGYREIAQTDPTGQLHAERFPLVIAYTVTGVGFVDEDRDPSTPGVFRRALTDPSGAYANVPAIAPGSVDPTASWWVAAERAVDGPAGDCDATTGSALSGHYPGRAIESDAAPILEARKDRPSATFTFYDGHRGLHPQIDERTSRMTPSDGGTTALDHGGPPPYHRGGDGPMWSALAPAEQDPLILDRETLDVAPALYFTYYAHIGPDARSLDLPSDLLRPYGRENCGDKESGVHNGWVCDKALWWRTADGSDVTPTYALGHRLGRVVGDEYQMRDVDCYDGQLARGVPVYASLAYFAPSGRCA